MIQKVVTWRAWVTMYPFVQIVWRNLDIFVGRRFGDCLREVRIM